VQRPWGLAYWRSRKDTNGLEQRERGGEKRRRGNGYVVGSGKGNDMTKWAGLE
jgi:hypothetical protein